MKKDKPILPSFSSFTDGINESRGQLQRIMVDFFMNPATTVEFRDGDSVVENPKQPIVCGDR